MRKRRYPNWQEVEEKLKLFSELNFFSLGYDEEDQKKEKMRNVQALLDQWFGIEQVHFATGLSSRTIDRRIADGTISSVEMLGVYWIHKDEIRKLVNKLHRPSGELVLEGQNGD